MKQALEKVDPLLGSLVDATPPWVEGPFEAVRLKANRCLKRIQVERLHNSAALFLNFFLQQHQRVD